VLITGLTMLDCCFNSRPAAVADESMVRTTYPACSQHASWHSSSMAGGTSLSNPPSMPAHGMHACIPAWYNQQCQVANMGMLLVHPVGAKQGFWHTLPAMAVSEYTNSQQCAPHAGLQPSPGKVTAALGCGSSRRHGSWPTSNGHASRCQQPSTRQGLVKKQRMSKVAQQFAAV
jgi:hypothetical protein